MMLKRIILLGGLFWIVCGALFAQKSQSIPVIITEKDIQEGVFQKRVFLAHAAKPSVSLSDMVYVPAPLLPGISLQETAAPELHMGMERGRPFVLINIPAYKTGEEEGLLRLAEVRIILTENEAAEPARTASKTTAASSVLSQGTWYKIAVKERGMYKISHDFLKNQLLVDPADIHPANIRLFGNGGTMLPEDNAIPVDDDLVENAIEVVGGDDGAFNEQDYILFYANGPTRWEKDSAGRSFSHVTHLYADSSYYFLSFDQGPGLRVKNLPQPASGNVNVTDFNDYHLHEEELINIGKFGKQWWGETFGTEPGLVNSRTFSFQTGNLTADADVRLYLGCRSFAHGNEFKAYINGQLAGTVPLGGVIDDPEYLQLTWKEERISFPVSGNTTQVQLEFSPGIYSGRGYLNYILINTRRSLSFSGGQMTFRDWNSVAPGNIATYMLAGAGAQAVVWEITDPLRPDRIQTAVVSGSARFNREAERLREFIAFDRTLLYTPGYVGKVENQNLHGAEQPDMLLVTHPNFREAAEKLAAHHRIQNHLDVLVASTGEVYNEFSSGGQDISAIRNFVRYFYQRAGGDTSQMPGYLLLFGDASYDYKDRLKNNTNFVPTYETAESINPLTGFCSDDFFSFLDDQENIEAAVINTMDISIGRLPVATKEAASEMVNKIIRYTSPQSLGPWRISTTIITDNGDNNTHLEDGEIMAMQINEHTNLYNETKVHLSAIPTVSTPAGLRAPDANKIINDQVFKGTFLMNYNGHGSIYTLTSERILTQDDFNTWKNLYKLPVMITATCDFSRFDDPAYVSAGEKLMLKPDGGAIALLTTTQLVYQYLNRTMNRDFLNAMFQQYQGKWPTFGDALRFSKNKTYAVKTNKSELVNFRKFTLLGDPAVTPAFPEHQIQVTDVVDEFTGNATDTIKALGKYSIKGNVTDHEGNILYDFNGPLHLVLYDKPRTGVTLSGVYKEFPVRNNIIYKGVATVENGAFSVAFITPKDLNYDYGKGKISFYAQNGRTDAAGSDTATVIGGFSDHPVIENNPPVVQAFINDSLFRDGGITGANTILYVQLFDETGINVSGNSIGHDLTAVLDGNIQQPYILNDYYETVPNDYRRGYVRFPISGLSDGPHSIRVKAWDANNNSGEGIVHFVVVNGQVMQVNSLMNYPNPFSNQTHFIFEHNHPDEQLDATIYIYSTSGYLVRTLHQRYTPGGSRSNEITWDGTSNTGAKLPAGMYVYKLQLATEKGIQGTAYQKLVLLR